MKKERDSNIELLRLIAMFLVLVVHADFFSLGVPSHDETVTAPLGTFVRFFFESASIVCVNVFVLISGWFGIRPSKRSFCNFVFQCLFFLIGIYAVMLACGIVPLTAKGIAGCFVMLSWNWFIKAYIGLYILAPVLNAFVENSDRKTFRLTLISFFAFQTIYSWINGAAVFFENGYSTMSFIGLYLLARYLNVYKPRWAFTPPHLHLFAYLMLTIIMAVVSFSLARFDILGSVSGRMWVYVNPLVIMSALSLLLCFKGLKVKSKWINWSAASSFAIFLLHTNPNLCEPYFKPMVIRLFDTYNGLTCLAVIFFFLLVVSSVAILADQMRKCIWKFIVNNYF